MFKPILTDVRFLTSRDLKRRLYIVTAEGLYEGSVVVEQIKFLPEEVRALGGIRVAREAVLDKLIGKILKGEIR